MNWSGNWVALVTPFRKGVLDWNAHAAHLERMIAGGVSGIVVGGTTGETPMLTESEYRELVERTVRLAKHRVPVCVGVGTQATAHSVERARHARDSGANALMVVTPYYVKPTPAGMIAHVESIAEAAGGVPILLYNIPGRTGLNLSAELLARLSELPSVSAVKESTGNLDQVSDIYATAHARISILSGDDSMTLPMMAAGAVGAVSVVANILPSKMTDLVSAARSGDFGRARELHYELLPLARVLFLETNPIPVKTALSLLRGFPLEFRSPLVPLSEGARERLVAVLKQLELL